VNFEGGSCKFKAANCADGACVVGAIDAQLKLLADASQPLAVRRDALKFVVHLVGDVHQPMHASNRADRGGNDFPISLRTDLEPEEYARSKYVDGVMDTNLHSVWDYYVLGSQKLDVPTYAQKLAASKWPRAPQRNPAAWATESCKLIDRRALYPASKDLDIAYLNAMRPLAEQRVEIAATRLARLLNSALTPR
jgi:nuclease S1